MTTKLNRVSERWQPLLQHPASPSISLVTSITVKVNQIVWKLRRWQHRPQDLFQLYAPFVLSICIKRNANIHPCIINQIYSCLINFPLNIFSQSGTVKTRTGVFPCCLLCVLYVPTVRREAEKNVWSCDPCTFLEVKAVSMLIHSLNSYKVCSLSFSSSGAIKLTFRHVRSWNPFN